MNEALRAYFPVADMIAATFGPCCEAAIHDFSQPETSVVHVAGQVTGRKVGQSFDHLIKNVLLSKDFQNDQSNNYVFQTPDGRTIKSSSVLLRDGGHVIGMLCINYDLTIGQSFYQQMAAFYGGTQEDAANGEVDAADDVTSIIDGLIDSILRGTDAGQMNRKKKLLAIWYLAERIPARRTFTEAEINDAIDDQTTFRDHATLRRELYNHHLLDRTNDGKT